MCSGDGSQWGWEGGGPEVLMALNARIRAYELNGMGGRDAYGTFAKGENSACPRGVGHSC